MKLEPLFEMETLVEELVNARMSRRQQKRVAAIRHSFGVISGFLRNGIDSTHDQQRCSQALVRIRTLCEIGHQESKTRQLREYFGNLLQRIGELESLTARQTKNKGLVQRNWSLVRMIFP